MMRNAWSDNINFAKKVNKQVHFKKFQLEQGQHKKALKQAELCTILNHSRTIEIVISLLCICFSIKHSSDITILIVLLWFSIVHYSACFSSFFMYLLSSLLQLKIHNLLMYLCYYIPCTYRVKSLLILMLKLLK